MPVYVLFDLSDNGVLLKVELQVATVLSENSRQCFRGTDNRERKGKAKGRATRLTHLNER